MGDSADEMRCLFGLVATCAIVGDTHRATACHHAMLAIAHEIGEPAHRGAVLGALGDAYDVIGEVRHAIECHEAALAVSREIGDRNGEGNHLRNLGTMHMRLEHRAVALDYWRHALAIFEAIGSPDAVTIRNWLAEDDRATEGD